MSNRQPMPMQATRLRSLATRGGYCVILCLAMLPKLSHATWYEEMMEPGADCVGTPKAVAQPRMPNVRHVSLDVEVKQPTIRMTAWDIFDQQAEPIVVCSNPVEVPAAEPRPATELFSGVSYTSYVRGHGEGRWASLEDIPTGQFVSKGLAGYIGGRNRGKRGH